MKMQITAIRFWRIIATAMSRNSMTCLSQGIFGCIAFLILLSIGAFGQGADTQINVNTTSTDLSLPTSYSSGALPLTTDDVNFTGTYTGTTFDVNGAALSMAHLVNRNSTQALTITNSNATAASITLNGGNNQSGGGPSVSDLIFTAGNLTIAPGAGALTVNILSGVYINNSIGGTLTISAAINTANGITLSFENQSNTTTISGNISGGAFLLVGAVGSVVSFSGTNTFTGGMTYSGGILNINSPTALGTGTFTVDGGAIDNTSGSAITLTNNNVQSWGGNFTFTGTNALNLGSGAVGLQGTFTTKVITVSANTLTVGGVISGGSGSGITKAGAGTLLLSGMNTYTGPTTVSAGNLQAGSSQAFGINSAVTVGGGNLDLEGFSNTIGSLAGSGGVVQNTGGAATLTLAGNNSSAVNYSHTIQDGTGSLSLVKNGAGIQTLSGTNTYTGGTTLNAGTLNINSATALGSGAFTVNGGTINNTSGSANTLTHNNPQNWNANFAFTGTNALNLGSGTVNLSATDTVTVNASTLTVGGIISGPGFGLTKSGAGNLVLSGISAYSGATTVSAGILTLNGSLTNSAVSISGSTLTLGASGQVTGNVTIGQTGLLDGTGSVGGTVTVNQGGTLGGGVKVIGNVTVNSGGSTYPGDPQIQTVGSVSYLTGSSAQFAIAATRTPSIPLNVSPGIDHDEIINANPTTAGTTTLTIGTGVTLQLNLSTGALSTLQAHASTNYVAGGTNTSADNYFLYVLGTGVSSGQFTTLTLTGLGTSGTNTLTGPINYSGLNDRFNGTPNLGDAVASGTVNGVPTSMEFALSYSGSISSNSTIGGNDIALTVVPEPSITVLLGFGVIAFVICTRGRRRPGAYP